MQLNQFKKLIYAIDKSRFEKSVFIHLLFYKFY